MPSTHQQLLYHIVFNTKNRKPFLANEDQRAKTSVAPPELSGWNDEFRCLTAPVHHGGSAVAD